MLRAVTTESIQIKFYISTPWTDVGLMKRIFETDVGLHCVSKMSHLWACYNVDTRERILIFFGRNVIDQVSNQKTFYYV